MSGPKLQSMTGFASVEGEGVRLELRTVNHRMLDIKLRVPRELLPAEMQIRATLQSSFQRGALDFKIERTGETSSLTADINEPVARRYFESLEKLRRSLGIQEPIRLSDLLPLPEVMSRASIEYSAEEAWKRLEPLVTQGIARLREMREHEGAALVQVVLTAVTEMEAQLQKLRTRRKHCESEWTSRIRDKVKSVMEVYPLASTHVQEVLESRIAQELALIVERTDIEEELIRFGGHLAHIRKTLSGPGPVGRKIDFILQELHREINTLGNKAQDLAMSEDVVAIKVRLEQLREQVMNLE